MSKAKAIDCTLVCLQCCEDCKDYCIAECEGRVEEGDTDCEEVCGGCCDDCKSTCTNSCGS